MEKGSIYIVISMMMTFICSIISGALICMIMDPDESRIVACGAEFAGMIRKRQKENSHYLNLESWLRKNGASYHIGKKTGPGRFMIMCMILGISGCFVGMSVSVFFGVALGLGLTAFLPVCIPVLNRSDNRKMLRDIKLIYHSLGVQIKSGVYVTDALAECSSAVENIRLRDALSAFYADVIMKSDIYASLERFRSCFDDRYIDSLCMTVVQALESGQVIELLSDIADQASDMENEIFESRKASLDRMLTFSQLIVLAAVLGTSLYTCIVYMMSRAAGFR